MTNKETDTQLFIQKKNKVKIIKVEDGTKITKNISYFNVQSYIVEK